MNQTIETRGMAERTGKAPESIMASYLTHELRAPVTAIKLGLEIFEEQVAERLQSDEKQMLHLAIKNTGRLQGLVNDIMDYTKVLAGKMSLDFVSCDPQAIIDEVVESFQAWAISKGVRLVKEVPTEHLPRIKAEPRRIIQVLTNLISNALKFTPARGTVTIGVRMGKYEHAGTLVFRVKDTGPGIPQEHLESIFETFQQSVSNGKQSDGTGLGLTLARSMVQLHGGRIWAESWKGLGATFSFTIPIAAEDLAEPIEVYAKPVEYHGIFVDVYRKLHAVLAAFF
ncbi:MAG: HAMP domain-containing histidine kinase [Elusimicrobia bacterium]|nr:HAMP domain-containing histidine kinase [Elusimicrobiota bacterium]